MEVSCSLRVWKAILVHASAECPGPTEMPGDPQVPLSLFNYHLLIAFLLAVDMLETGEETRRRGRGGVRGDEVGCKRSKETFL